MKAVFEKLTLVISIITVILTVGIYGFAQDLDDVTISGKVLDSNGLAIVGATVTATLTETDVKRPAVTDENGRYRIIELTPGLYSVEAVSDGFGAKIKRGLETLSGVNVQLDFRLDPASVVVDPVEVTDENASPVDTTRTIVGGTVTRLEVEELPNASRDALDFVFTLGGVAEEPLSTRDLANDRASGRNDGAPGTTPEEAGIFSLSGGAAYSNNITIDGFDNNDDRTAGFRFQPSIEAVDEVQVITNQFSAEYGRASGGRVNIRTRRGTQKFRGRLFYFFRDESLNANTYRNNARNIPRTAFQENDPGFTLGGPVPLGYFKDKTFFFTSYEYQNVYDNAVTDTYVPITQNPNFAIPAPTNPNDRITNPGGFILGRYLAETTTPKRNHAFTARITHNFNDKHDISVQYQLGRLNDERRFNGGNTLPEGFLGRLRDTDAINFADNYVFNQNTVNNFKFQYSRLEPQFTNDVLGLKPVTLIGIRDENNRFQTLVVGSSLGASDRRERRYQIQDSFASIFGDHTIRFGFDVQRVENTYIDLTDVGGTFNFSNVEDYLANDASRYRQNFFTESDITNTYTGFFAQDDWRFRPNLSFSFGLRYEQESVIDDKNNFGPRFAVAYSPFKDGKGVIRFGAGVFYNRVLLRTVDDFTRGTGDLIEFDTSRIPFADRAPFLQQLSGQFPGTLSPDSSIVQQYIAAGYNNTPFLRQLSSDIKVPESYQFNLGFEREISKSFVFEVNATVNRTARLWREVNINAPVIPDGFSNFTDYLIAVSNQGGFNNTAVSGIRPIYNVSSAGDTIRFQTTPVVVGANSYDFRTVNNVTFVNLNSLNSRTAAQIAIGALNNLRPDPNFTQIEQVNSIGNAWYRGVIFELRRRYRKLGYGFGTSIRMSYTLSKTEDDGIVNTSNAQIGADFPAERAESIQSRRHRFVLSGIFDTPNWFGKLRFSPFLRLGSGNRFNVSIGGGDEDDRNLNDTNSDRPNFSGNLDDLRYRKPGEPLDQTLVNAFTIPTLGSLGGNLPRNAGIGPTQFLFDLNVSRQFRIGERFRLRPQIEFDNILNATVFSFGSEFINFDDPDLFLPTRTYRPRQIRLGIRFDF